MKVIPASLLPDNIQEIQMRCESEYVRRSAPVVFGTRRHHVAMYKIKHAALVHGSRTKDRWYGDTAHEM
jgi:hypothetical protein